MFTLSFISLRQVKKSLKMNLGLYPQKIKTKTKTKTKKQEKQEKNYKAFYYLLETFVFQLRI